MFRTSTSTFDALLAKATSQLLLEPDWSSTLAMTDLIRGGEVQPKYAVAAIKKKFYADNPHVALYALQVMESCVKNCGALVHDEVATKAFMEELRELVKRSGDENIKKKILEMIQNWGMAFRNSQKYRIVTDTLNLMKAEGWEFPPVREAEAMFEADVAPEWAEGEVCHRCRTPFGIMTRQHHCRACGQVFCGKCSARTCLLPKYGIEKEVRVCDSCFDEHGPKDSRSSSGQSSPVKKAPTSGGKLKMEGDLPAEYLSSSLAKQSQAPPQRSGKTEEEIKEEEELQLALALSQSEAEEQEKAKKRLANQYRQQQQTLQQQKEEKPVKEEDITPELMKYLNRDYWEQKEMERESAKSREPAPTKAMSAVERYQAAGAASSAAAAAGSNPAVAMGPMATKEDEDLDEFVTTLKTQVEIFVNRMKSNSSRGRSIANDSSVQTLFMNTMAMHSQLLKHIQAQEDKRVHYEGLQDKITQVKDARAALEALREEEKERKRREAEEAERLRQIQMQEKLEVMRKKKQEYLQYQRQMALQKMQEQEREMMLRQEQAKQAYMMGPPQMTPGAMQYAQPGMMPPPGAPHQMYPVAPQAAAVPGSMGYMPPTSGVAAAVSGVPQQTNYAQPAGYAPDPNVSVASQPPQNPPVTNAPGGDPGLAQVGPVPPQQPPSMQIHQQQPQQPPPQGAYDMQGMNAALPQMQQGVPYQQMQQHPNTHQEGELITFE